MRIRGSITANPCAAPDLRFLLSPTHRPAGANALESLRQRPAQLAGGPGTGRRCNIDALPQRTAAAFTAIMVDLLSIARVPAHLCV